MIYDASGYNFTLSSRILEQRYFEGSILARKCITLNEDFRHFPQPLQANVNSSKQKVIITGTDNVLDLYWEMPGSNLGRVYGYPDRAFSQYSSVPTGKFREAISQRLLSKSFPIYHSSIILQFDAIYSLGGDGFTE
jgi:hypothetical protein